MIDCWTTPDIKPFPTEPILFYAGGGQFPYLGWYYSKTDMFGDWKSDDVQKWAYVNEIIAQAGKAERLQKALCFICNIRGAGMSYQDMFLDAHEVAKTALDPEHKPVLCGRYDEEMLDEIKQLIKGE